MKTYRREPEAGEHPTGHELRSMAVEIEELGPVPPPIGGAHRREAYFALVGVLVALAVFVGAPAISIPAPSGSPPPSAARGATATEAIPSPRPPVRARPHSVGRGATIEHAWVVDGQFIIELRDPRGIEGYGSARSVLRRSTDGLTWTEIHPPRDPRPAEPPDLEAATAAGERLWVAATVGEGPGRGRGLWSIDPAEAQAEWRWEGSLEGVGPSLADVEWLARDSTCIPVRACDHGEWLAVVRSGAVDPTVALRRSDDGRSWGDLVLPEPELSDVLGIAQHWGVWVILATRPRLEPGRVGTVALVSGDGFSWTSIELSSMNGGGRAVVAGASGFVVAGSERAGDVTPQVWRSSDGYAWEAQRPGGQAGEPELLAAISGGYAALSRTGTAWVSAAGGAWRGFQAFEVGDGDRIRAFASAGDVLLAVGQLADGRPATWVRRLEALTSVP